ncbi:hypothetical protein EYF80_068401 [Liparis tanakae]|uniref:Uncharacterized protein n=1 Tax=Liparis tanakae TaxID=230148 RepID=A0A4Z2DYJ2_9TELE|nr:hypothetical protein EYF80_068401 [Liparis tanakae]
MSHLTAAHYRHGGSADSNSPAETDPPCRRGTRRAERGFNYVAPRASKPHFNTGGVGGAQCWRSAKLLPTDHEAFCFLCGDQHIRPTRRIRTPDLPHVSPCVLSTGQRSQVPGVTG